jgi:hypothetical protein
MYIYVYGHKFLLYLSEILLESRQIIMRSKFFESQKTSKRLQMRLRPGYFG